MSIVLMYINFQNMKIIIPFLIVFQIAYSDDISDLRQEIQSLKKEFDNYRQEINDKLKDNEQSMCDSDWITYSDRKCFKVLQRKGSESEAKANCSQLDSSSTLITIQSLNEQNFLSNHMKNYKNISDYIWIGLEFINKSFQWIDRSDFKFENWDENAVRDGTNKCVQMSLTDAEIGKWTDDMCQKKYLIVCQKKQSTKTVLSEDIKNITNVINKQQEQLNSIVPLGFLYTQLPNQSTPQQLWPNMNWTEVSAQYSGIFFRVVGEESAPFGQIQKDNSPRLTQIYSELANDHPNVKWYWKEYANVPKGGWSGWVDTGNTDGAVMNTKFYVSDGEVRPRNMAIKIWKRIG